MTNIEYLHIGHCNPTRAAGSLNEQVMLLVPVLQTIIAVDVMHALLPLRPTHPVRLRLLHDTDHLVRNGQLRVDSRCERMNQLWPVMVPEPQHGAAIGAEIALRRTQLLARLAPVFDGVVFSLHY